MRGQTSEVSVLNLDNDNTLEMVGLVENGDVYVFDGATRLLEAILPGPFREMVSMPLAAGPSILLGTATGHLATYRFVSGAYTEVSRPRPITTAIDGVTIDAQERIWLSSGDTLTVATSQGATLASLKGYGSPFGRHIAFLNSSPLFFTTGSYGIFAFSISTLDSDGDGIPDIVELQEGRDASVKDNDVFSFSRLFVMQQ
jgi:hypothetical protein